MKRLSSFFILATLIASSCKEDMPVKQKEIGYLSLKLSAITIDKSSTSGRTKAVPTDDFIVKIYRVGEPDPVLTYDPWSSAPVAIELETGEYYAEAQNLDPPEPAAFDQPWYYGKSANFSIDKEELETVTISCKMANFKVAFVYSDNVVRDFTDWNASVTLINEGVSLDWNKDDGAEGYFITSPASIQVHLVYIKLDGGLITRDFSASIGNPQPATLYRINVDASLQNGEIMLDIGVDDSFTEEDIDLGG